VLQTKKILKALPSLVDITVPHGKHITVCGDVHGQVIGIYLVYYYCMLKQIVANKFSTNIIILQNN